MKAQLTIFIIFKSNNELVAPTSQLAATKVAKASGGDKCGNNPLVVTKAATATHCGDSSTIKWWWQSSTKSTSGGNNQLAVTKAAKASGGNKCCNNASVVTKTAIRSIYVWCSSLIYLVTMHFYKLKWFPFLLLVLVEFLWFPWCELSKKSLVLSV